MKTSSIEQRVEIHNSQGLLADMKSSVAVIITHPWGPLGGNMNNNVVMAVSSYFQKWKITTLRFDFVGSQIGFGTQQVKQVEEAANFLLNGSFPQKTQQQQQQQKQNQQTRPKYILLIGYSYGSLISASASANIPQCIGYVSIAPPFSVQHWLLMFHSNYHMNQAKQNKTLKRLYVIGKNDNFTSESVFLETVATFPKETTTGIVIDNNQRHPTMDHFFFRREKYILDVIQEWILKEFPQCNGNIKRFSCIDNIIV